MQTSDKPDNTGNEQQMPQGNRPPGIATVDGSDSQTPEERDAAIGTEPDTKRLRSERESVEQNRGKGNVSHG
jgi:hypothetical protein